MCNYKVRFCPYNLIREYLSIRPKYGKDSEQFFIFSDKSLVTSVNFLSVLRAILEKCEVDPKLYGTHSFRAGRSVDLWKAKVPISVISKLGRWKSNVVFKYLANI